MARTPVIDYAGVVAIPAYVPSVVTPPVVVAGARRTPVIDYAGVVAVPGYVAPPAGNGLSLSTEVIDAGARGVGDVYLRDDYALIQSLLDEAYANLLAGGTAPTVVQLPPKIIVIGHPIELTKSSCGLIGTGVVGGFTGTRIYTNYWFGPHVYVGPVGAVWPTGTSLITGAGAALRFGDAGFTQLPLSIGEGMQLDGRTEATIEVFVKPTNSAGASVYEDIFGSTGSLNYPTIAAHTAFSFQRRSYAGGENYPVLTWTKLDGTQVVITGSTALTAGVVHHVAMVVHAGTVTLWVDGISQGSFSETGLKITQNKYEELTLGQFAYVWPNSDALNGTMAGLYDSFRFSDNARYTAPFTPSTTKFVSDANTWMLIIGDEIDGNFITSYLWAGSSKSYIFTKQQGIQIGNWNVENLELVARGGLIANNSVKNTIRNITTVGCWDAVRVQGCYLTRIENIECTNAVRFGYAQFGNSNEENTVTQVNSTGAYYPIVLSGASGGSYTNLIVTPHLNTEICYAINGGDVTLTAFQIDDEGGGMSSADKYGFFITPGSSVTIQGGQMDFGSGNYTPFWIDRNAGQTSAINLNGVTLYNFGATNTQELVKVTGYNYPINLNGCTAFGGAETSHNANALISVNGCVGISNSFLTDKVRSAQLELKYLPAATAPTVTLIGASGSTTWSYKIVAKLADGTTSPASPVGSLATGSASLPGSIMNIVWTAVPGAFAYDIYRTATGTSPATLGKIITTVGTQYYDQGAAGDGATAPTTNLTGIIKATGTNADITVTPSGTGKVSLSSSVAMPAVTFANLPAAPVVGQMIGISDSNTATFNANITAGGGANKGIAYYNGANWTFR